MIDGDWIAAQIQKYIAYLDSLPQERPAGKAEASAIYAAGLRDMANDILEGIRTETAWQQMRAMLDEAPTAALAEHGWKVEQ